MNKKLRRLMIYLPLFWFVTGFVLYPLANTIVSGFRDKSGFTLAHYRDFILSPTGRQIILNTLVLGVATVIVCGIIGTALALLVSLTNIKGKKLLHTLLLTPIMIPGVLIVLAFIQLYGESGMVTKLLSSLIPFKGIGGFWGILFIHAYTQYVYFYMNVSSALENLDYSQIEAARCMGASSGHILKTIILPFIRPALFSSAILTFMSGISSYSAPNLLGGYKVLSTQIMYSKINNHLDIASMQVTLMLVMGMVVMLTLRQFEEKSSFQNSLKATPFVPVRLSSFWGRLAQILVWILAVSIVAPILCVVLTSFAKSSDLMTNSLPTSFTLENYQVIFSKKRVLKPFLNSLSMTLMAVGAALVISLPTAYLAVKRKGKLSHLLESGVMLPVAIPVGSIAINLINAFAKGNAFSFGQPLIGTFIILPLAYVLLTMPMLLRSNRIAMENFNTDLEYSAKSLGASPMKAFVSVTFREIFPFVVSGAIIAYIRTFGEYTVSAFLYGVHNKPVSIAMVSALQEYDIGLSMAYGTLTILVCFTGVLLTQMISHKFR